jgi:hypothetical protein
VVADEDHCTCLQRHLSQERDGTVSGEDAKPKQLVMALLDEMGFDSVDAGLLSESSRYQPGTPAYCPDPTIQQLPSLLQRAKRDKAAENRDQAAKLMAKLPLTSHRKSWCGSRAFPPDWIG